MTNSSLASGVLSLPGYQGYKYDGLNRLTSVDGVSGNIADGKTSMSDPEFRVGDASYSYDQIGNITDLERWGYFTFSPTAPELQGWSYTYGTGNNRLQSVDSSAANVSASRNYSYDLNGNLLSDSYRNIDTTVYGRANLPFLVNKTVGSSDESIDYLYNASDMRIFKKHIDHDTANVDTLAMQFYLRDASGRELGVYDVLTDQWTHYAFGGSRFAKFTPVSSQQPSNLGSGSTPTHPISYTFMSTATKDTVSFYNFDHLGNTRVVYETDQPTAHNSCTSPLRLSSAVDYFPYGKVLREVRAGDAEKYLTTHHERDLETGLDYRGARMYDGDVARFLSLDPAAAEYPAWSDYNYVAGNPSMFVDPDGKRVDDYKLNKDGTIELISKTSDDFDQLFSTDDDGSVNKNEAVKLYDRSILRSLVSIRSSDRGSSGLLVTAQSNSRDDMYSLFKFAADNSDSEWAINHSIIVQGSHQYSIGTFFDSEQSPSAGTMGVELETVVSHMHSHPNPGVSDLESMGWWRNGQRAAGDWHHEINRYRNNGNSPQYYNAVYFPQTGRVYNVQAVNGPVYIRNVRNDYKRFFYGRL